MSRWLDRIRLALRALVRRGRVEDELDEEMQYHLERQIEEGVRAGLSRDDARFAALRAMGAIAQNKEACRDLRRPRLMSDLAADVRYAARGMRRQPGFTLLAVGIMAIGIGANSAVFSVVNGVLLKPLPYPGADRITTLRVTFTRGGSQSLVNLATFRDWREQSRSFEAMATYRPGEFPVTPNATAEYARTASVDPQFFRVFSVEPILGRGFTPDDMASDTRVLLISHAYWQSRFGGDPRVLGRAMRVSGAPARIVGVLPAGFEFPDRTEVWGLQPNQPPTSRTRHNWFAVARLRPDVTIDRAQSELATIGTRLAQQYPQSNKDRSVAVMRLQDELVGDVRFTLYLLWGVVGLVMLIACANTATLLLGKATTRVREIAVRAALGAGRARIVRQLITESVLLGVIAAICGVLIAAWVAPLLAALAPAEVVRRTEVALDAGVLLFTLGLSVLTSVLFGLVPALQASRVDLAEAAARGGTRVVAGGGLARTRGLLVVSEIVVTVVLVTGAGLLLKSLLALYAVDLGFRPENVLVMRATALGPKPARDAFFREVRSRLAVLPGVVAAGATSIPPGDLALAGSGGYFIDRMPAQRDRASESQALMTIVAPATFAAQGTRITAGRDFSDADTADTPQVAIVNEALVRKSMAGQEPLGRTIHCAFDRGGEGMTIVGVVADVRTRNPAIAAMPECYMPFTQHVYNDSTLHLIIRTTGEPTTLAGAARRIAAETAPDVAVSFTTMDATLSKRVEAPRFRALLFAVFAALAVCLAMAGVYGVMAHAVGQRSREIGLRMALGASRGAVLRLVLREGLVMAGAGLVLGLGAAVALGRVLSTVLFEVQPIDAQVYLGVALLLAAVTLLAGYLPARRAAAVDPVEVLKAD
jgi:putative ABC transport system permease protein